MAQLAGFVSPDLMLWTSSGEILIMVIIGGAGSFWGVVVAGLAMAALPEILRFSQDLRMIIYGAVLLVAMLAVPGGVAGFIRARAIARMKTQSR